MLNHFKINLKFLKEMYLALFNNFVFYSHTLSNIIDIFIAKQTVESTIDIRIDLNRSYKSEIKLFLVLTCFRS